MKRIFSGVKTPEFPAPPKFFQRDGSSSSPSSPKSQDARSRSSSFSRIFSGDTSPKPSPVALPQELSASGNLSPELVPIVTLLSAHAHRRYHEGVFLLLQDLKGDGTPAARKWQEVYGVLIGTQLALWDAKELAECNSDMNNPKLKQVASKPHYINFTDATLRPLDGSDAVVTESKKKLENALIVSTTLKNRYFLQYSDKESFNFWNAAIRLSLFECTALQEAYTGAFLSSRGAKLGDIKIILADSKFDYEDWVSVRFGTGMPWKRCYAVISQSNGKKKHPFGTINFYESDKKVKKGHAMATVVSSKALYAVYPSSPLLIDTSTIIKLEGEISFGKKQDPQETNIFIMPEKHQAVPGYDTIIRFLIPAMNAFKLYGRPKKLIANKDDQQSLLFALPTLPRVHYLKVEELLPIANSASSLRWSSHTWRDHISEHLLKKLSQGYTGCGSAAGVTGALASPVIGAAELFEGSGNIASPTFLPKQRPFNGSNLTLRDGNTETYSSRTSKSGSPLTKKNLLEPVGFAKQESESLSATSSYSARSNERYLTPHSSSWQLPDSKSHSQLKVDILDSNFDRLASESARKNKPNPVEKYSNASDLSAIYDKYSVSPFGKTPAIETSPIPQTIKVNGQNVASSPYEQYVGSSEGKTFEISNMRDSTSTTRTNSYEPHRSGYHTPSDEDEADANDEASALDEFNDLAKRISEMGMESMKSDSKSAARGEDSLDLDLDFASSVGVDNGYDYDQGADDDDANVFDPDFSEQNQMLENESRHSSTEDRSDYSRLNQYEPKPSLNPGLQEPQKQRGIPLASINPADERIPHSIPVKDLKQYTQQNRNAPHPRQQESHNAYMNSNNKPLNSSPNYGFRPQANLHQQQANLTQPQGYMNHSQSTAPVHTSGSPKYQQYQQQGYKGPSPSRPTYPPYQQHLQQQSQPRPYPQHYPQQQYAPPGGYNNVQQGPRATQQVNLGGPAPRQPMYPQGGRAGPYPSGAPHMGTQKARPPPNGGFSQFMPSTDTNPYSK